MTYAGHTTRTYRVGGLDLFMGVLLNGVANLLTVGFHLAHRHLSWWPGHASRAQADFCFPTGVVVGFLLLSGWAVLKRRELRRTEPDAIRPGSRFDWLNSYGLLFNTLMIAEATGIAWLVSLTTGTPALNHGQTALVIAFWTTAFTYLPVLGVGRVLARPKGSGNFIAVYIKTHGHLLVFPVSVVVHSLLIGGLMALGFAALLSSPPSMGAPVRDGWDAIKPALFQIGGLSLIIGFFGALPLHRRYERLVLGYNPTPDPERERRRIAEAIVQDLEKERGRSDAKS